MLFVQLISECGELKAPLARQSRQHCLPPRWRRTMPWRGRVKPRLADRLHGNTGSLCDLGVADAAGHAIRRGLEIHGCGIRGY